MYTFMYSSFGTCVLNKNIPIPYDRIDKTFSVSTALSERVYLTKNIYISYDWIDKTLMFACSSFGTCKPKTFTFLVTGLTTLLHLPKALSERGYLTKTFTFRMTGLTKILHLPVTVLERVYVTKDIYILYDKTHDQTFTFA